MSTFTHQPRHRSGVLRDIQPQPTITGSLPLIEPPKTHRFYTQNALSRTPARSPLTSVRVWTMVAGLIILGLLSWWFRVGEALMQPSHPNWPAGVASAQQTGINQ